MSEINNRANLDNETRKPGESAPVQNAPAGGQQPGVGTFSGGNSTPNEPDYKEKFGASTRENQRIMQENQALQAEVAERNKKLQDLTNVREPTDDEMKAKYNTWETMTDTEKFMAKDNFKMELKLNKTASMVLDTTVSTQRKEQLASVYSNPIFAVIATHFRAEFEQYVRKPEHEGMDLNFVAKAFLIDFSEEVADKAKPAPANNNSNRGLENGSGGEAPAQAKLTDDEINHIKHTDQKRYQQLIRDRII